jgi:hypothetical protein
VRSAETCADCHAEDVVSGERALSALPNLDKRKLDPAESGSWPRTSRKKRRVELLHLLLLGDPELDEALAEALRAGEINDSNDLSRIRSEEAGALALELDWATKRLLLQLAEGESASILARLGGLSTDGSEPDPRLLGSLSQDLVGPAAEAWFPQLEEELTVRASRVAEPAESRLAAIATAEQGEPGWWSSRGKEGLTSGGWYREDRNTLIGYRPTGHADPVLAAWIEQVARLPLDSEPAMNLALTLLDPKSGPGRCMKCHALDGEGSSMVVNRRGAGGDDEQGSFTVFRHGPHVGMLGDDSGCETCHSLDRARLIAEEGVFAGRDPSQGRSSFGDVDRSSCASCHAPDSAGDSCADCHRYHVGAPAASAHDCSTVAGLN